MSHPVDLHVLRSPDWPDNLLDRALESARYAPANVHVVPWERHHGRARAAGYLNGRAPYVGFLDADDEIIPEGLERLIDALASNPRACGVYGAEQRIREDGATRVMPCPAYYPGLLLECSGALHNAVLMRRDLVERCLGETAELPLRSNWLLRALLARWGPWQGVDAVAYRWHLRAGTLRLLPAPGIERRIVQALRYAPASRNDV